MLANVIGIKAHLQSGFIAPAASIASARPGADERALSARETGVRMTLGVIASSIFIHGAHR